MNAHPSTIPAHRTFPGGFECVTWNGYQLRCGYVATFHVEALAVTMWHEHGAYHVRAHDHGAGSPLGNGGRLAWETFRHLSDARRCFRSFTYRVRRLHRAAMVTP